MNNIRIALLAGVAALCAGAVGPWVSALGVINIGPTVSAEASIVVFGGIALLLLSFATLKLTRATSILVGVLALSEAGYTLVRVAQAKAEAGEWGALIQPGWGVYLTIITGLYLIVSTFIANRIAIKTV